MSRGEGVPCIELVPGAPLRAAPKKKDEGPPEGVVDNVVYRYRLDENGNKVFLGTMPAFPEGWNIPKEFKKGEGKMSKDKRNPGPKREDREEIMEKVRELVRELVAKGTNVRKAAKLLNVPESTIYHWLKQEREETQKQAQEPIPYQVVGKYEALGKAIGALVDEKNLQYGDAFNRGGCILEILYPDGVRPDQYRDMLGVIRVIDKLFRVANGKQGSEDPWQDIAGYGLLGAGE